MIRETAAMARFSKTIATKLLQVVIDVGVGGQ